MRKNCNKNNAYLNPVPYAGSSSAGRKYYFPLMRLPTFCQSTDVETVVIPVWGMYRAKCAYKPVSIVLTLFDNVYCFNSTRHANNSILLLLCAPVTNSRQCYAHMPDMS